MPDPHSNFGYSTVATAPSPASSGTSLVVQAADGVKFPSTGSFNATVWPVSVQPTTANAEIVRVTAISTDTFTITRAQESTSARTIVTGDQIAATITKKTLTDVEANLYLTTQDETLPANSQYILDDYIELASSFSYELAGGAVLVIGDYAAPVIGPGYELNYTQITSNVNLSASPTVTTILSPNPIMFDGSNVLVHFFTAAVFTDTGAATDSVTVSLYEGGVELTRLCSSIPGTAVAQSRHPASGFYRFAPTAGLHTYTIGGLASATTGTPAIAAGSGGAGNFPPAFVRFTKI